MSGETPLHSGRGGRGRGVVCGLPRNVGAWIRAEAAISLPRIRRRCRIADLGNDLSIRCLGRRHRPALFTKISPSCLHPRLDNTSILDDTSIVHQGEMCYVFREHT